MTTSTEAIYSALFAKLKTAAGFKTYSRRLKVWTDVTPDDRPYLCLATRDDAVDHNQGEGTRGRFTLEAEIFVYTACPLGTEGEDDTNSPSKALNDAVDAVRDSIAPLPMEQGKQTLGGLVSHCWIDGRIIKEPGDLDGDGLAIIPIRILVP